MEHEERELLLAIARRAIHSKLAGESFIPPAGAVCSNHVCGLFVSLHNGHRLRGCVGRLDGNGYALGELVRCMAINVLEDPRFAGNPVTLPELAEIMIELSLLSPMRRCRDPLDVQPGVHGVYVRNGDQAGCFLPQVAEHMKWSREDLLSRCCRDKAGLGGDAWRDPATEIYLFTAEIFSERGP